MFASDQAIINNSTYLICDVDDAGGDVDDAACVRSAVDSGPGDQQR